MESYNQTKYNPEPSVYNPNNIYPPPPPSYEASADQANQYGPHVVHEGPNMGHAGPNVVHAGPNVMHAGPYVVHAGPNVVHAGPTVVPAGVTVTVGSTVVGAAVVVGPNVGPKATVVTCRACRQQIVTRVEYKPTQRTHIIAALLCFFGTCLCCVPYCVDSCKSADHYCPNCNAFIATYQR